MKPKESQGKPGETKGNPGVLVNFDLSRIPTRVFLDLLQNVL